MSALWKATEGKHTVTWQIDPDLVYNDPDRNNNYLTETFDVGPPTPTQAIVTTATQTLTTAVTVKETMTKTESKTMTETLMKTETKQHTVTEKAPTYALPDAISAAIFAALAVLLALTAWIKYELHQYGKIPRVPEPKSEEEQLKESIEKFKQEVIRLENDLKTGLIDQEQYKRLKEPWENGIQLMELELKKIGKMKEKK